MQPFGGPRRKLKRAAEHLKELHRVISKFLARKPYSIPYHLNTDNSFYECRLEFSQRPPEVDIGILVGEIAYQLRSVLDHIIFELSLPKINEITDLAERARAEGKTQFPIFTEENEREFGRGLKFVDEPIWDLIKVYQPYSSLQWERFDPKPEKTPLAVLQAINNTDKHRLVNDLSAAIVKRSGINPRIVFPSAGQVYDGDVFALVPADLDPKKYLQPLISVEIIITLRGGADRWRFAALDDIYRFIRDDLLPDFSDAVTQLQSGND